MFGSEKLKFQVLTAVSRFGTSIHQISASLENALFGKNKKFKKFVVVEVHPDSPSGSHIYLFKKFWAQL
jgi:hypothetical protein